MFEVNFFEKKQKNVLPHVLIGLAIMFALGSGLYFFFSRNAILDKDEENRAWLVGEAEQLAVSRQIKQYEEAALRLQADKPLFEERRHHVAEAATAILDLIPGGAANTKSFSLDENKVILVVDKLSVAEVNTTMTALQNQNFVTNVQFIRMEAEGEAKQSLVEIWVLLDEAIFQGEVSQ